MNFGNVVVDLIQSLLKLGGQFVSFMTTKIDISNVIKILNALSININLPEQITAISLIGSIGGLTILTFIVIKLIRG